MLPILKTLLRRDYRPLNQIEISSEALVHNYNYLTQLSQGKQIAPVLKSNAYGHGISEIGKIVDTLHAPFICVDSLFEAYQLQKAKIKTPILIMGYVHPKSLHTKKLPFSFAVFSSEMLEAVKRYQPQAPIHIFVDTGMHREGVPIEHLSTFIQRAKSLNLAIQGLMSHFAMADKPDALETKKQIEDFTKAQDILRNEGIFPQWIHLAASSGILNSDHYPLSIGNVSRAGIAFFGIAPSGIDNNLQPVLTLTSTIAEIKQLKRGDKVGYDFTFTAEKDITIAVIPIGYNDGVDRRLSNNGFFSINKKLAPIIGKISMNITTIDISEIPDVKEGDQVTIFSHTSSDKNSINSAADLCQTIPYELLIHLNSLTRRVVK